MKTLHIFYTAQSIPHRCISQSLYNAGAEDIEIQTVNVFGRLFDFTERAKPKNVFFSICDYSQEVHDWINDHQQDINIFLLLDKTLGEKNTDLWTFLCQSQVKVIANTNLIQDIPSQFLTYDNKYDSSTFNNREQSRNERIAVMSSGQDEDRVQINELLYPKTKLKINIFNDINWASDQNLGMLDPVQLNDVLNTYSKFIDLSSNLTLEAQACGINCIDTSSGDIKQAIEDNKTLAPITKLENRTYDYFTKHEVLPYIRKNT
jgi:hypothetical protein